MPTIDSLPDREFRELHTTHALLNPLWAAYQGLHAYLAVASELSLAETGRERAEVAAQLDLIYSWWSAFRRGKPLAGVSDLPALTADCKIAHEMLRAIQARYALLCDSLASRTHIDALFTSRTELRLRVAVYCETVYARQHYIEGLIEFGKVVADDRIINTYARHLASCREEVRRVGACVAAVLEIGDSLQHDAVREIFDETLTLPAILGQKVADLQELVTLAERGFEFHHTGIPSGEVADWQHFGFKPATASQWQRAGFDAATAYAWTLVGISVPIEALEYQLRQFDVNAALPWWSRGINGRTAAAWRNDGYTAEQAAGWRAQGIGHPRHVAQPGQNERLHHESHAGSSL